MSDRIGVFTVAVDNYFPELCEVTHPNHQAFANKLKADYIVINKRAHPEAPPTYEKLQVWDYKQGYDWLIIIDADFMIHPDYPDIQKLLPRNCLGTHMMFHADQQFPPDVYFLRDGRNVGIVSHFLVIPPLVHDVLTPLTEKELETALVSIKRPFIVDEYCISRNVARFGIKTSGLSVTERQLTWHADLNTSQPNRSDVLASALAFQRTCVEDTRKWLWTNA